MGCDIHFRVEYFGPAETVVLEDGQMVVKRDGEPCWQPAEKLTPNKYHQMWVDELAKTQEERDAKYSDGRSGPTDEQLKKWIAEEPELALDHDDRFYTGRNYGLFWMLTGTRGAYQGTPLPVQFGETTLGAIKANWGHGRGLPEDVSPEVGAELPEDDADLHTHSWYTLKELLDADWTATDSPESVDGTTLPYYASGFGDTLLLMEVVAIEKCEGDATKVRAVFAYDN